MHLHHLGGVLTEASLNVLGRHTERALYTAARAVDTL